MRWLGSWSRSGRWLRPGTPFTAALCLAGCFAPTISVPVGNSNERSGTALSDANGSAVAMTCPAFIQSWALAARGMRAAYLPPELADNPNIQDPHSIAVCAAARDTLWCQHHNGIFRSVDGAATWQAVAPVPVSDFGFAVAAHPRNPDCAWFVPAIKDECRIPPEQAMAVLRTRDGGQSFDVLRDGLPQQDCFDLVYRHGLAVADNGEQLLMGSTTGSLWASENGGEHWQRIGSHFPPVLAVAFEAD